MLSRSNPENEKLLYWPALLCLLLFLSCRSRDKNEPLFSLMENTGIHFINTVEDGAKDNSFLFRNFYNGGGVAIGDINNDGLADIFFTSNAGANKLYLNKGNFKFEDISEKAGILSDDKWNTGVVFADVNADGWLDIYVCSSGHMSTGNRKNKLYINNRQLGFADSAAAYGLDISAYTTQVSFFDYDRDGDLDCFMINNSPIPVNQLDFSNKRDLPDKDWPVADFLKGGGDHLFRNDNGRFVEVTKEAGIHGSLISFGLGVSVGDINDDGWPDVFVANDSYERDYLYINQGDGTFKDELTSWMQHVSFSSMGADIADINNDGYPDLFTTDMFPLDHHRLKTMGAFDNVDLFNAKLRAGFYYQYPVNSLQLNNKNGMFKDIARYSGIPATDWSWGALIFDMDNDGWNDILVCNGVNRDVTNLDFMNFFADEVYQKMVMTGQKKEIDQLLKQIPRTALPNKIFRNNKDLRFLDMGEQWGLGQNSFSNGAAYGDLDNDGDLDLVISNENQPSFIYRNNSREKNNHHYIGFSLQGKNQNPFAIGTKIKLYGGGQTWLREQVPSRGFQSSVDYKILVGLGDITQVDSVVVIWPGQTLTVLKNPGIDQVHQLKEPIEGPPAIHSAPDLTDTFFEPLASSFDKHVEDDVIDFYAERNIPRLLSREGPKAAVADVNADGLEDVYIGGTPGHPGQLYLQDERGTFKKKVEKAFLPFSDFEDAAVLFFDADRDNDPDLLVCPGGNTAGINSRQLQLRFFRNDGQGNFSIDVNAFPNTQANISVAIDYDFTGDGYPDLFIGGRNHTGVYGKDPNSYLFVNDGQGHFTDKTNSLHPEISQIGMVCGATWANLAGDGKKELVIAGEWMSPRVFSVTPNRFEEINTNLSQLFGWWQTISTADVNGDGKEDLLLGNIGENF
ncbi:MAG TPA: VCBS repeat-containing protein, partial [Chitinophagaceae bacterium]|nr:VCBS repeat-containing protein [Chitinophagaceae bacterium]